MQNKIEINRNGIEKFLMKIKDVLKHNRKKSMIISAAFLVIVVLVVSFAVYRNYEINKSLEQYADIMSSFEKEISDISKNVPMDEANYTLAESQVKAAKSSAAAKIAKLAESSKFGYMSELGYYVAAGYYLEGGNNAEAVKHFDLFVSSNPDSDLVPLAMFSIGLAYENSGETAKALESYLSIEKKYPNGKYNARVLYDAGRMYQKSGDLAKAKEYYEKVKLQHTNTLYSDYASARIMLLAVKPEMK